MGARFWAAGSAVSGVATTLALVAPTLNVNDIIIAQIASQDNDAAATPDSTWTIINELNNGTGLRSSLYWKRAVAGSSGATFTFTGLAGTTSNMGILTAYRGCKADNSPIGNITSSANVSADAVTYATLTPLANSGAIIAAGFYADNATTAGTITSTAPAEFTNVVDVEAVPAGAGLSLFQYWGDRNVGGATGALSHATTSTTDGVNNGILFELLSEATLGGGGSVGVTYPRLNRRGVR